MMLLYAISSGSANSIYEVAAFALIARCHVERVNRLPDSMDIDGAEEWLHVASRATGLPELGLGPNSGTDLSECQNPPASDTTFTLVIAASERPTSITKTIRAFALLRL